MICRSHTSFSDLHTSASAIPVAGKLIIQLIIFIPTAGYYRAIRWPLSDSERHDLCSFSEKPCVLLIGLALFLLDHFQGRALNWSTANCQQLPFNQQVA